MAKARLLIVEDDLEIANLTAMYLHAEGYQCDVVEDGEQALAALRQCPPQLMILDLMLPKLSGVEVCQQARQFYHAPILVLTACADEMSEVSLLKLGADDYLTKPIKPHLLVARIEALLRRSQAPTQTWQLQPQHKAVRYHDHTITLTDAEFEMMQLLTDHVGQVVSREHCCQALRGIQYDSHDRSVDMRISSLRKKLNDAHPPYQVILTIRNKGYMLVNG
ncbi:response regulator transcription factor [uncultured Ferrimonas sp.]|uniref:response regulator transcription factor n=1 Tax=uncultured Ferrimonas sp. TaxID=432640 RepID=UPI002622BEA0|nr:response regulator transcription factor [uncultured Ferrimonas sp.]